MHRTAVRRPLVIAEQACFTSRGGAGAPSNGGRERCRVVRSGRVGSGCGCGRVGVGECGLWESVRSRRRRDRRKVEEARLPPGSTARRNEEERGEGRGRKGEGNRIERIKGYREETTKNQVVHSSFVSRQSPVVSRPASSRPHPRIFVPVDRTGHPRFDPRLPPTIVDAFRGAVQLHRASTGPSRRPIRRTRTPPEPPGAPCSLCYPGAITARLSPVCGVISAY